jgi:hypothetical protein
LETGNWRDGTETVGLSPGFCVNWRFEGVSDMMRRMFLLAVVCLFAASVSMAADEAKKEGGKKRGGFTAASMWERMGGKVEDGKPVGKIEKADYIKRVTDDSAKRKMTEEQAKDSWKRWAGEGDSITAEEFVKAFEKRMEEMKKKGGERKGKKKAE